VNAAPRTLSAARVSVIVPAWQRPLALVRCLRALATQQRAPDEVIVVTRTGDDATETAARAVVFPPPTRVMQVVVHEGGVIAAMQAGLDRATGDYIALTDDDAEPRADWIARLTDALDADPAPGGVGGRDWQPRERGDAHDVGRVQWFGRVIGRHHLGAGPARDVDVLKGVNCCFRAEALRAAGFDTRLRGAGAQVHWELATCLPMRRAGWRLRYDPATAVEHHVEARAGDDQVHRGAFAAGPYADAVHNEALVVGEHLRGASQVAFALWSALVGTTSAPGLLATLRLRAQGHAWAWEAWRAARHGRALARETHRRTPRRTPRRSPRA
jgi:GT2 family glycosyltransferase